MLKFQVYQVRKNIEPVGMLLHEPMARQLVNEEFITADPRRGCGHVLSLLVPLMDDTEFRALSISLGRYLESDCFGSWSQAFQTATVNGFIGIKPIKEV